jgi:predicted dehydrogenase
MDDKVEKLAEEEEASAEPCTRREFIMKAGKAGAASLSFAILPPKLTQGTQANSKVKLGIIGCGGRGTWIAGLFQKHGGYEITAAADYFSDRLDNIGAKFSIPNARLFPRLSGYKRLLEAGLDAVVIESPPYFHPEQASAAVAAGLHVYLAKPSAVDVPGCRTISECGKKASEKKRVFLIDFQTRANPAFVEAVKRVHEGAIGEFAFGESSYHADCPFEPYFDSLRTDPGNPELKLRAWGLDRSLSGDIITEQEIHTLDVMNWIMNEPPLWATGSGGLTARPKIGTCWDHFVVYYQYDRNIAVHFSGRQFKGHGTAEGIRNRMFGSKGVLETQYGGNVVIRGENFWNGGLTSQIYEEGAVNNIAAFHGSITNGHFGNDSVLPSVRSNLITILGRKAAYENRVVTWAELMRDDERLIPDLKGLKE